MWIESLVDGVVRLLTGLACRVEVGQFYRGPTRGPLILVVNQVSFLEAPPAFLHSPIADGVRVDA